MIAGFRFQTIRLRISQRGQRVYFNGISDKDFRFIRAICLSVGSVQALYGSTIGIRIDEKEILDESHEAHLLVFGPNLPPNEQMLSLNPHVPVQSSKIEGIYTDCSLQGLLGNAGSNTGGGIISKNEIKIKKTYVSGKDIVKYSNTAVDSSTVVTSTVNTNKSAKYPYDVRITFLLGK